MEPKQRFSVWYLLLAVAGILAIQLVSAAGHRETLAYSDFKRLVQARKARALIIDDKTISGQFDVEGIAAVLGPPLGDSLKQLGAGPHSFITTRVTDPGLVAELEAAEIRFTGRLENTWFRGMLGLVVPAILFLAVWVFLMGRMGAQGQGQLMAVGKSKAKVYVEQDTGVRFDDVAGIDEARAELAELVEFLRSPDTYRRLGGKIPKGALLIGPPGAGKTLLAKAVAGEAKVPFFSLTGSDFVEMFVGVGAARVRDLFAQAHARSPSIIFVDELDALGRARSAGPSLGHDEREQTLNQLLAEMDGFDSRKAVIILAATNRPEILDPALLRPGRFDRKIVVDRPDLRGRLQILRVHTRGVSLATDVDLAAIAARTPGFVGADLANLVNEAALHAARTGQASVGPDDFEEALDRVVGGITHRSRALSPREKGIVAYHEAGHALIAELRERADPVAKVSIIPRGVAALGYTQQQPTEDRYLMTKRELLDRLDVLLGGRVAEELAFGDVSTGAHDDLQRATDLVRYMVTAYGMSEALGLATYQPPRSAPFLESRDWIPSREYSERTARAIDDEIRALLTDAQERVRQTLSHRRVALDALALLLMKQEVVTHQTLSVLLTTRREGRRAPGPLRTDPVCGMSLAAADADAAAEHAGRTVYFCSDDCRRAFVSNPERYTTDDPLPDEC
ncbi:MAG: ATP-dependent zinc metalloprotease FtsH [Gemmatimonadales bacterium]